MALSIGKANRLISDENVIMRALPVWYWQNNAVQKAIDNKNLLQTPKIRQMVSR